MDLTKKVTEMLRQNTAAEEAREQLQAELLHLEQLQNELVDALLCIPMERLHLPLTIRHEGYIITIEEEPWEWPERKRYRAVSIDKDDATSLNQLERLLAPTEEVSHAD